MSDAFYSVATYNPKANPKMGVWLYSNPGCAIARLIGATAGMTGDIGKAARELKDALGYEDGADGESEDDNYVWRLEARCLIPGGDGAAKTVFVFECKTVGITVCITRHVGRVDGPYATDAGTMR